MIFAAGILGFFAGAITVIIWALCRANKDKENKK